MKSARSNGCPTVCPSRPFRKVVRRGQRQFVTDPVESAQAAGLRYVRDDRPGIQRKRRGKSFRYLGPDGKPVRDRDQLRRIRSLAIPPAWTDVWICPNPQGHLQATGHDARGRKQYRYHPRWRSARDETKYDRLIAFGQALPRIRARIEQDLAQPSLSRTKVLATVVRLLETTLIRVGNEEYARENGSFGLTTLRNRHVSVNGQMLRFTFKGKSGVRHNIRVDDRRLARIVRRCQDMPGQELFQYLDEEETPRAINSADVNAYLQEIAGQEFTAKDFRTWAGTVLAARALQEFESFDSQAQAKRNVVEAIESVSKRLGNTKAVCRKCYVHPAVINAYLDGSLLDTLRQRVEKEIAGSLADLPPEEAAVLAFLQERLKHEAEQRSKAPDKG
ncbi:MAG TPA: DNA topoisomerase IB [Gemmataceae bacterium]|nr:DNA topoisomerase IB [Gemmataceae bacterium]